VGDVQRCVAVGAVALVLACVLPSSAAAQRTSLACGKPITATLEAGAEDSYELATSSPATVVVDVVDVSGTIDLLHLETDDQETCMGLVSWRLNGDGELQVSDCIGHDSGRYALSMHVVSEGPDNCAEPMLCGEFPYVRRLVDAGQVDAYSVPGKPGDQVTIRATSVGGTVGSMRVRLFGPDGSMIPGTESCSGTLNTTLHAAGNYTVLISACGLPTPGLYLLGFESPSCPTGPEVTHLGIARADGTPLPPDNYDDRGRPVYLREVGGSGFVLVFEAQPGPSHAAVGLSAFDYDPGSASVLPDLQVLVSRPLGNGSAAVCDKTRPDIGGVPAVPSLDFDLTQSVSDAVNDFGCRIDNGAGVPAGVASQDACTSFTDGTFHFIEPSSTLQYCMLVSQPWAFRRGRTIVKARVRDMQGHLGAPREMAIQVGPTNPPYCSGDCNDDGQVTVDELITGVSIALESRPLGDCDSFDDDSDGSVTIPELIKAMISALNGCPAT
jgi:hypothetical protein